jgi:hypothetical protein
VKTSTIVAALALSVAAACNETPSAPLREITLSFCSFTTWIAYQNEGGEWRGLPGGGSFTIRATERLTIAMVEEDLAPFLQLHFLTAEQAAATYTCPSAGSTKTVHGTVRGLGAGDEAYVTMGLGIATASSAFPSFTLGAPEGAADLVATQQYYANPAVLVRRVIVRRAENHLNGATIQDLDFASSEAFAPQENVLTLTGVAAGTAIDAQTNILTNGGTENVLGYAPGVGPSATLYSMPASRVQVGDLHIARAGDAGRSISLYYNTPSDRTLSLGPPASQPNFTTVDNAGPLRLRVDIASQPEYGSGLRMFLYQRPPQASQFHTVYVVASKEYFGGTPATWSFTIPDLRGVAGFETAWGLEPGSYLWDLRVLGSPYGFTSRSAHDGDVFRSASASSPP